MDKKCFLTALTNPNIKGVVPGIVLENSALVIDNTFFACCNGQGQIFDSSDNRLHVCDLNWRFLELNRLFSLYYSTWKNEFPLIPQELNENYSKKNLYILNNIFFKIPSSLKRCIVFKTDLILSPSKLWPMAFAATWRYGVKSVFICFGRHKFHEHIKSQLQSFPVDTQRKTAIFVGKIDKLYDAALNLELESLISYAYDSCFYLFLEFVDYSKISKQSLSTLKLSKFFNEKVSLMQKNSVASFLSQSSLSKLKEICSNLEEIL